MDKKNKELTTPPPASQERGGKVPTPAHWLNAIMACVSASKISESDMRRIEAEAWRIAEAYGAMFDASRASPPSSAAEHRLEMFTKSPGLHEAGCPLSGTPNLYASCDCGLGAAEQASSAAEGPKEVQEEWNPCIECGADPGEPCYPNCCTHAAEQAKPDRSELIRETNYRLWMDGNGGCEPPPEWLSEQAQAGEIDEAIEWLESLDNVNIANRKQAIALLRRLAGGVTAPYKLTMRSGVASCNDNPIGYFTDERTAYLVGDLIRAIDKNCHPEYSGFDVVAAIDGSGEDK